MRGHQSPYATLVLPDGTGLDIEPYLDVIEDVFVAFDPKSVPQRERSRIIGTHYAIAVRPMPDGVYGPSVAMRVLDKDGLPADDPTGLDLLTVCAVQTLHVSNADIVEFCDAGTLYDRENFIRTFQDTVPDGMTKAPRIRGELGGLRSVFADEDDVENTPSTILTSTQTRDTAKSRLGAAGWLMTAALAAISLPVAVALAIFGLLRGMEFRLATQVVSVTVLFVALSNTDSLNQIVYSFLR